MLSLVTACVDASGVPAAGPEFQCHRRYLHPSRVGPMPEPSLPRPTVSL
jgi:hypothetical protein